MKGLFLTAIIFAFLATENATAQSALKSSVSTVKSSEIHLINTSNLTDILDARFGQFESGVVEYSAQSVRLLITSSVPCGAGKYCIMMPTIQTEVNLKVKAIVKKGCSNIYYAQTADNVKSMYFEEIKLEDPNTGRCQYIQEAKGELIYRITGESSVAVNDSLQQKTQINWAQFLMGSESGSLEK